MLVEVFPDLRFKLITWFGGFHGTVLRLSSGKLMHSLMGLNMLLLSTKGRRTGRFRDTPLLYLKDEDRYYCVASFGGNDRHPQWFLNLIEHSNVTLSIRGRHVRAKAKLASANERDQAWNTLIDYYPPFAKYQERTARSIPVIAFLPLEESNEG